MIAALLEHGPLVRWHDGTNWRQGYLMIGGGQIAKNGGRWKMAAYAAQYDRSEQTAAIDQMSVVYDPLKRGVWLVNPSVLERVPMRSEWETDEPAAADDHARLREAREKLAEHETAEREAAADKQMFTFEDCERVAQKAVGSLGFSGVRLGVPPLELELRLAHQLFKHVTS